jgi:5-formyltetrahydrofolate cyclo-ligase
VLINGQRISSTQLRKQALRQQMLEQRMALPHIQRETRTQSITQSLFSLTAFQQAQEIFTYVDFRKEVGTRAIMQQARA